MSRLKKKSLFIIDSLDGGGAERVLINLLKDVNYNRNEVTVLLLFNKGSLLNELPPWIKKKFIFQDFAQIKGKLQLAFYRFYVRVVFKMMRIAPAIFSFFFRLKEDYDLGVSAYEGTSTFMLASNRKRFEATVAWVHTNFMLHKTNHRIDDFRRAFGRIDRLLFVSEDASKSFDQMFPELKVREKTVLSNPFDIIGIQTKSKVPVPFEKKGFTILSVGRLVPSKGFDKLLKALVLVREAGVDAELLILGSGPEKDQLVSLSEALNISFKVTFVAFTDNPYPYFRLADIFVSASDYEGYPMAIGEAMILQKTIVATNVSGNREILAFGKYGLLVENNVDAIAEGIKEVFSGRVAIPGQIRQEALSNFYAANKRLLDYFSLSE